MADQPPRLPAYLKVEYRSDGTVAAISPRAGEEEAHRFISIGRAWRCVSVVLTEACRHLIDKARFDMPVRVQLGDERCNGLCCPDAKPSKGLRVRFAVFGHVLVLRAGCDEQHGTAGGDARKRSVAPTSTSQDADAQDVAT